jgi:hypothetical protein
MIRSALLALAALSLASCAEVSGGLGGATSTPYETAPATAVVFDARDFAWSTAAGSGEIVGAFAFHQGDVRYSCRGADVLLTPETAWSRRRMIILYGSARAAAAPVSIVRARTPSAGTADYARFVRRATCDEANHFAFHNLPDGGWFLITVGRPVDGAGEAVAVTRRVETHGGVVSATLS